MEKPSKSAAGLKALINHAINDLEITPDEYRQIMEHAHADSHLDKEEQALLAQFHEMLNNGTIKRVRG
jgi:3-oxoacyl-(acyl-carrier-protein) synthase